MEQITCKDCGEEFILTERDVNFFEGNGLSMPKRCWACRQKRRDNNRIKVTKEMIGKRIYRTKAAFSGDRSYIGKQFSIKVIDVKDDGTIVYEYIFAVKRTDELDPRWNDGYWKVLGDDGK